MILLVGQYSTGKTTFIRHLLERDFPGIRIGPEPTTGKKLGSYCHGEEVWLNSRSPTAISSDDKEMKPTVIQLLKFDNLFCPTYYLSSRPLHRCHARR